MVQFEITLKNDRIKFYKLIALLLVLLNLVFFVFFLIAGINFFEAAAAVLISGSYLVYLIYAGKRSKKGFLINEITFFLLAGSWIALQNYFIAFACVVMSILYHLSLQKPVFVFNEDLVKKINIPQKTYLWEALANVVLKDNILTIDLKNNTLIQSEIEGNINEIQFNEFAQQQLIRNQHLLKKSL